MREGCCWGGEVGVDVVVVGNGLTVDHDLMSVRVEYGVNPSHVRAPCHRTDMGLFGIGSGVGRGGWRWCGGLHDWTTRYSHQ